MLVVKDACILRRVKMSDVYNWIPLKIYLKSCSIVDAFRCNLHKIHEIEIDIKKNLWYYKFNVSSTLILIINVSILNVISLNYNVSLLRQIFYGLHIETISNILFF